MIDGKTVDGSH